MSTTLKISVVGLSVLLLICDYASCLIIPDEVPTILSLVYSNIPPIKKGTDSRLGVGFRLGDHADFQILVELGPQTETERIGGTESTRRRDAMYAAAMKGELGPFARAIAKYQIERKIYQELERLKKLQETTSKATTEKREEDEKNPSNDWLTQWSKGMPKSTSSNVNNKKETYQKIRLPVDVKQADRLEELTKLYEWTLNNVNGTSELN